jgi:hypothetical protein
MVLILRLQTKKSYIKVALLLLGLILVVAIIDVLNYKTTPRKLDNKTVVQLCIGRPSQSLCRRRPRVSSRPTHQCRLTPPPTSPNLLDGAIDLPPFPVPRPLQRAPQVMSSRSPRGLCHRPLRHTTRRYRSGRGSSALRAADLSPLRYGRTQ